MLLDERLLESPGGAIARTSRRAWCVGAASGAALGCVAPAALAEVLTGGGAGQGQVVSHTRLGEEFARAWPQLHARLIGLERAHGVLFGALARRAAVSESEVFRRMAARASSGAGNPPRDQEADAGYALLGARAAETIRRTHLFHREVLAIFAILDPSARTAAIDDAVGRYVDRPGVSLPDRPKDMTILYDHPYTTFVDDEIAPVRQLRYPTLTGFVWASHWYQLAVQEPLERARDAAARKAGLDAVAARFQRKLVQGPQPDAFPAELPLAPSIAPGLVLVHPRAAAIFDNLSMMLDVLMDVLVHPQGAQVRGALDTVVEQFSDRTYRVVEIDDWITMALRHSIFAQGGPALETMTESDRNSSGHFQHARRGARIPPGGMR